MKGVMLNVRKDFFFMTRQLLKRGKKLTKPSNIVGQMR